MWTEINQQPHLYSYADNTSLLPDPKPAEGDIPSNTLYDELILQYRKVVTRAEDMVVQQVCGEIETALKVHFSMATPSVDVPSTHAGDY